MFQKKGKTGILHILSGAASVSATVLMGCLNIFKKEHLVCFPTVELYLRYFQGLGYDRLRKERN